MVNLTSRSWFVFVSMCHREVGEEVIMNNEWIILNSRLTVFIFIVIRQVRYLKSLSNKTLDFNTLFVLFLREEKYLKIFTM